MIRGCGKGRAEKGHSPVEDEWMRTCVVGNSPPLIPKHTSCDPQYHSVGNFARLACEFSGRNSLLWSVQFGADLLPERVPRNRQQLPHAGGECHPHMSTSSPDGASPFECPAIAWERCDTR